MPSRAARHTRELSCTCAYVPQFVSFDAKTREQLFPVTQDTASYTRTKQAHETGACTLRLNKDRERLATPVVLPRCVNML